MADRFKSSVVVDAPASVCYEMFHNFEQFPQFMNNVQQINRQGDNRWHWVVNGPFGKKLEWDAVIDGDEPGKLISWHTISEPDVGVQGAVRFDEIDGNHTQVTCTIQYEPPAGLLGEVVAVAVSNPQKMVEEDLHNFKNLVERGQSASAGYQQESGNIDQTGATTTGISAGGDVTAGGTQAVSTSTAAGMDNIGMAGTDLNDNEESGYNGPFGIEDTMAEGDMIGVGVSDQDEAMLPDIRSEEDPYLGADGALDTEDLIDMRDDSLVGNETDVFTESMDVYEEDLESFTEDLDEEIDPAITPREDISRYELADDGSLVNPSRPTEGGAL